MVVKESIIRDALRLITWYPLRWLIEGSPIRSGFTIFRIMGDIHFYLYRSKSDILMKNMQSALDHKHRSGDLSRYVRDYFRNHYVNQLSIFLFPRLNRANIEKFHTFEGLENLDAVLKKGHGCILLHPHMGPTQLPLCALGILGYPMMQLGLLTNEGLSFIGKNVAFRLRAKYETKIPATIVSADSILRPIIRWLRNNGVLMMAGDGAGGGKFIGKFTTIRFMGHPFPFPIGAAAISNKTGAPILPTFTVLAEPNRYRTIILEPISMTRSGVMDSSGDIVRNFAKIMEDYISKHPSLWHFWDEFDKRVAAQVPSIVN
jgi:phosphatidylinositol dimannoside acyltransferase